VILILQDNSFFQGVKAIQYLENICKYDGIFFKLQQIVFSNNIIGNVVYEVLKLLRIIALKLKKLL